LILDGNPLNFFEILRLFGIVAVWVFLLIFFFYTLCFFIKLFKKSPRTIPIFKIQEKKNGKESLYYRVKNLFFPSLPSAIEYAKKIKNK